MQSDNGTGIDLIVQRSTNAINDASIILARSRQNDTAEQDEPATKALIWLNALLFQELPARYLDRAQLPTGHQKRGIKRPDLVLHTERLRRKDYHTFPKVPIIEIGNIAESGPYEMQVKNPTQGLFTIVETDDPLRAGIPALWHHSSTRETSLQVTSNARLERRPDRDKEKQDRMLAQQCRLHLARDLRMAPQRLAAVLTDKPMLGARSWVTLALHSDMPGKQETLCLWLNSTLGLLMRILHGNRPYPGSSSVPHELIRTLPVLDVNRLSTGQLTAAARIYEDLKNKTLQGFSRIQDDPVRNELNARLYTEVPDIDGNSVETLTDSIREPGYEAENLEELVDELTHKLASEPAMPARH